MKLYRFRLVPEAAWRTPWQSDTLAGMLCGAIARLEGSPVLRQRVIEPALKGEPPFVVSDAFPGDWLPVPNMVRLLAWPAELRKAVKRSRWLTPEVFALLQRGEPLYYSDLIQESGYHEAVQLHNTISRASNLTSDGGNLFAREDTLIAQGQDYLSVYVRLGDDFRMLFWQALCELETSGFGADRSAGKGQFRIAGELEPVESFDNVPQPNGVVTLSTFQPNQADPIDGVWEAFTKYGKLGPEFGLDNVFKRPLVLFKPGASFRTPDLRLWLGRAIPMGELLAPDTSEHLRQTGIEVVHYAFGLTLPIHWRASYTPELARPIELPAKVTPVVNRGKEIATDDFVEVTLLEPHKVAPHAFRVQEAGKAKGMLVHGTPPNPLPEVGAKVRVYREPTSNVNNPSYRWTKPEAPLAPKRANNPRKHH